jgi:Protein of unknown function (DUF1501)
MRHLHQGLCGESRRTFMLNCARAAFGVTVGAALPSALFGETPPAKSAAAGKAGFGKTKRMIFIAPRGGMSHIDSFDPKPGAGKGPGNPISTTGDFQITSFFPETAKVSKHLCLIRSMTAKIAIHAPAAYLMRTGFTEQGGVKHPIMGAWAQSFLGPSHKIMPSSVTLCRRSDQAHGFFPVTHSPIAIGDPADGLANAKAIGSMDDFRKRNDLLNLLDADFRKHSADLEVKNYTDYYAGATELMKSTSELESFDISKEPKDMQDAYGPSRFGQACLLARRLISAGTRFVEIEHGEWDHHKNLTKDFEEQASDLDRVYATLITDLQQRGMLDSTMVVIASEFGRSPSFNGGRNHYPSCFTTVLAGGGVKGGFAYSASDERGAQPVNNPTSVGDLHATLGWAFGLPIEKEALGVNGRTYVLGNRGKPALGVFA